MTTPHPTSPVGAVVELGRLAMAFGAINRTAVYHPDRVTPESDTDHTVMLGWIACAVAARWFPHLDLGLVAQFALIHDAPEVYAGDTPTLRIDAAGRAAKAAREHAAVQRLTEQFSSHLPWFPAAIATYEAQELPEARFVRGLDKAVPKIVHLLDGCTGLRERGIGRAELANICRRQHADLASYVGDFPELLDLYSALVDQVLNHPELDHPPARVWRAGDGVPELAVGAVQDRHGRVFHRCHDDCWIDPDSRGHMRWADLLRDGGPLTEPTPSHRRSSPAELGAVPGGAP
jgi:putative hydrolase of HD superfamily